MALSIRRVPLAYDVLTIVHSKSLGHCKLVIRGFVCRLDAITDVLGQYYFLENNIMIRFSLHR
jgi:hypothetical protein